MNRSEKEQIIAEVSETVRKVTGMYLADFTGLTVAEASELRRELRKAGIDYRVAKNTLVKKALEAVTGYDGVMDKLVGPTAVVFSYDDPVVPAKIIKRFKEKHAKLSLKAAVLEKRVYGGDRLDDLARIPSRKETLASILGSIEAPLSGIPATINALLRDLVSVIGEVGRKKAA